MSKRKDIVLVRCRREVVMEHMDAFQRVIREQLPPDEYIVFLDGESDKFDIELVSKPIVINGSDGLDEQLEKLNSLIQEIRDGKLNEL